MMAFLLRSGTTAFLGVLLLLGGAGPVSSAPREAPSPAARSGTAPDDTTGAQIHTERIRDRLRVQGVFVNADVAADTLRYELFLRREGTAGTTQTTQSGPFAAGPGRADTLSATVVNVRSGDTIDLRLRVRRDNTPIDSARVRRTIP